jgi:hypothetical protein
MSAFLNDSRFSLHLQRFSLPFVNQQALDTEAFSAGTQIAFDSYPTRKGVNK